jgi:hypothetical protein
MSRLKCVNCNIVINELLAYIQNKISIIDEDSLAKICVASFTSEDITVSKTLLLESLSDEYRKKARKGLGKENRELHDIISLFKVVDPDVMPVFVARELEKLPPITFDHLDVSKMLKDHVRLEADIREIKSSYATLSQVDELKNIVMDIRSQIIPFSVRNVNVKRGGGVYYDSGPMGLSNLNESSLHEKSEASNCASSSPKEVNLNCRNINISRSVGIVEKNILSVGEVDSNPSGNDQARVSDDHSGGGGDGVSSQPATGIPTTAGQLINKRMKSSFADAIKSNPNGNRNIDATPEEWTLVQRQKRPKFNRLNSKIGNSKIEPDQKFKAADRRIPIFISNVHMSASEMDICTYIRQKTCEDVSLEKIAKKSSSEYVAYKFFIPESKLQIFLDEKLWPQGIIFRRFVNFKRKAVIDGGDGSRNAQNGLTNQNNE